MATAPKDAGQQAAVILELSPDDIAVDERLGVFWPDKAAAIGKLMAEDGQNDPIKVRRNGPTAAKRWTLIVGLHRLEGAKLEGLRLIDAIAVTGNPATLLKIEASENVERGPRTPLERANFVRAIADAAEARLKDQHGDLTPQQIAVRARWDLVKAKAPGVVRAEDLDEAEADDTRVNITRVYGWRDEVAAAIGLSVESIKKDLALHRAIIAPFPHLWRDLARHPIVGDNASALKEIAAVRDEGSRRQLISVLIQHPAMTVLQGKVKIGIAEAAAPASTGATKHMENATANLARLSAAHQRQIAPEIVATLKPTALIAMRDLLLARIAAENITTQGDEGDA